MPNRRSNAQEGHKFGWTNREIAYSHDDELEALAQRADDERYSSAGNHPASAAPIPRYPEWHLSTPVTASVKILARDQFVEGVRPRCGEPVTWVAYQRRIDMGTRLPLPSSR
jgi:hypothetical protein